MGIGEKRFFKFINVDLNRRAITSVIKWLAAFDFHTISVCKKVNWKISVFKRSSYLFNTNFRITLFKLFIISKFDYCSTLFFHFQDASNEKCLDKNLSKALKSYLNIKLYNLNISEQYDHLKSFRLMPLRLRFFQNLVFFIFSLIKCRHKNALNQSIDSLKKNRSFKLFIFSWKMVFLMKI